MIKWGIIGAGTIAQRFAASLTKIEEAQLVAVANRTLPKARAFQQKHHASMAFDSYQELLDLAELDMVYIALPHAYHAEWIKKAIVAGKGILCEKPAVLHAAEWLDIQKLLATHPVFLMEAMKSRFTPAYQKMAQLVKDGEIGTIQKIETCLRRDMPKEGATYHYLPEQGGCLLDMGIYNIALLTDFVHGTPTVDSLTATFADGIETSIEATLTCDQIPLVLESGFDLFKPAVATIKGTQGTVTMPDFHRPTSFRIDYLNGQSQSYELPYIQDDFHGEIVHAMTCFKQGLYESPQMTWSDSLRFAQWIDWLKSKQ